MIFTKDLDSSLLKILETDTNIRKDLLNLLNSIPEEVFEGIKSADLNSLDDEESSINIPEVTNDETIFTCNIYKEDEDSEALYIKEELASPGNLPHINFIKELYLVGNNNNNNEKYLGSFSLSISLVGTFDSSYIPIEGFTPIAKSLNGNGKVFGYIKELCYMYDEAVLHKSYIKISNSMNEERRLVKYDLEISDITLDELNERYNEGYSRKLGKKE